LAVKFKGEVINADSRQVYRYMNIGTAKPEYDEISLAPHHLFDILNPDQDFGLAQFLGLARDIILEIQNRNKAPFLVGGSGQYLWSIIEGWQIPQIAPDIEYRKSLEVLLEEKGIDYLYNRLKDLDPLASEKIDKRNVRRVIRALEVSSQSDKPFSKLKQKIKPDYKTLIIGLTAPRTLLYQMVDERVDKMLANGLIEEIKSIIGKGYDLNLPALNSIGYKQVGQVLKGILPQDELAYRIKVDTHRFIRHQYAWFSLDDERIRWFDISLNYKTELESLIRNHLDSK
jgi:tRNA dimethylallyltransferase